MFVCNPSRLMSGLQASISTHIARQYYYPDGRWAPNIPLFVRAVGSHIDRLNNLYFTFLFVLRAVVKSGDFLTEYYFDTGNQTDDTNVRNLVKQLVTTILPMEIVRSDGATVFTYREAMEGMLPTTPVNGVRTHDTAESLRDVNVNEHLEQCRNGFDESRLLQVDPQFCLHPCLPSSPSVSPFILLSAVIFLF